MKKNLLLFGASVSTAMGSALLVLTLVVTSVAFAQTTESTTCTGSCVWSITPKACTSDTCELTTGCKCPSSATKRDECQGKCA